MGEMNRILPQGPNIHCGTAVKHSQHPNCTTTILENAYCDGVPLLPPFVEFTMRVPLGEEVDHLSHGELLADILREGLGSFVLNFIEAESTRSVLRVRFGGQDRAYPLKPEGFRESA